MRASSTIRALPSGTSHASNESGSAWARVATRRQLAALSATAVVVLALLSAAVWHGDPGDRQTTTEAYVYFDFADRVARGAVPYRDVTVEYPPGALPIFLAPLWLLGDTSGATWDEAATNNAARRYEAALAVLLAVVLAATILVTAASLRLLHATLAHAATGLGVLALTPILLGALPLTRYDAWPVLLTSVGVLAALAARDATTGVALGLAATAKLYPLVLLPGVVARVWRDRGPRRAAIVLGSALAAAAIVVAPFLVLAPSGTVDAFRVQLSRGLQMESLGGSILAAIWKLSLSLDARGLLPGPLPVDACQRCGGIVAAQLTGTLATLVGVVASIAVIAVLALAARRTMRMTEPRAAVAWSAAVAVTALVALGKVLSAQFLLWLLPLVLLVAGRRGRVATALLVVAAAMTNVWFPSLYRDYVNELSPGPVAFLLIRNGLLVALLVVLMRSDRPRADS